MSKTIVDLYHIDEWRQTYRVDASIDEIASAYVARGWIRLDTQDGKVRLLKGENAYHVVLEEK